MKDKIYLQKDACEVIGIDRFRLGQWIKKGWFDPPPFSKSQIVGIAAAAHLRERGCEVCIAAKVARHFNRLSDELLEARIADGRRVLITSLGGNLVYLCREGEDFRTAAGRPVDAEPVEIVAIDIGVLYQRVSDFLEGVAEAVGAMELDEMLDEATDES